jgi:hypothetical protein
MIACVECGQGWNLRVAYARFDSDQFLTSQLHRQEARHEISCTRVRAQVIARNPQPNGGDLFSGR